jgi:hypothetical protein
MVWQPDVWDKALRSTQLTSFRMCRTKEECERVCAQQPGWRPWAYDLGKRDPKASNHPKAFVAAPDDTFLAAYALVPAEHRHAYEIVAGPCDLFLDLEREGEQWQHGSVLAEVVEEAACAVVSEMAALQRLQVRVDTVAIDCDHAAKFSRHLLVRVTLAGGEPVLWRGPREVGAVVARVAEWAGTASEIIDRCVYADGRCLRLLGSRKLCGDHRAPLELNAARSSAVAFAKPLPFAEAVRLSLAAPTAQPAAFLEAPQRNGMPADRPTAKPPSGQRGGDAVARRAVPAVSQAAWRRQWRRLTAMPLLDVPRMPHPRVLQRRGGAGLPPPPLAELARWGAGELSRLGSHGVARWEYLVSDWPEERLLHLTALGGHCAHVGRAHRANNIMLTIDVMNGLAWQRCFDHECVVRLPGGGHRKARLFVGVVPAAVLPLRCDEVYKA